MELNQAFLLIQYLYMGVLQTILCSDLLFLLLFLNMLQCTKEGVYILFPSRTLKLSNLDLNIYLPALNLLNASSTKGRELKGSRSITIQVCFFMNGFIKDRCNIFSSTSKCVLALSSCFFSAPCAGSLDM